MSTRHGYVKGDAFNNLHDCGKIDASSEAEARRIREAIAFIRGETHPVRYYPCDPETRQHWHWTRQLDETIVCDCGRRIYTPRDAERAAERIGVGPLVRGVHYSCPYGNHHLAIYPTGIRLRHCPTCRTICYPTPEHAQLVGQQLRRAGTRRVYQCDGRRWHLTITKPAHQEDQ